MKRTRFAVFFAALVSMLSFTSCLDSDGGSNTSSVSAILRVNGFAGSYWFTDMVGNKYTPSSQSALASSGLDSYQFAYIMGTFDAGQLDASTSTKKEVIVDLYGASPVKAFGVATDDGSEADEFANAPMYAAGEDVGGNTYLQFFSRNQMFVPVSYFYKSSSSNDDLKKELNSHEFYLFYDKEKSEMGTLSFKLRHRVQDPTVNKDRTTLGSEYLYFNIAQAMAAYKNEFGSEPANIRIEYQYNYSNGEMTEYTSTKEVTTDFQQWLKWFEQLEK